MNLVALWFFAITMDNFCGAQIGFLKSKEGASWINYFVSDFVGFNLFLWTVVLTIKLFFQSLWRATAISMLPWLIFLEEF